MKHIKFKQHGNRIVIYGSNDVNDILTSAQCWPKNGYHAGAYKAAMFVISELQPLDRGYVVKVEGHSMGGAIAQVMAIELSMKGYNVKLVTQGAFPAIQEIRYSNLLSGRNYIYGNDPVPSLYPWFKFPTEVIQQGPERKWWKINFKDHLKY